MDPCCERVCFHCDLTLVCGQTAIRFTPVNETRDELFKAKTTVLISVCSLQLHELLLRETLLLLLIQTWSRAKRRPTSVQSMRPEMNSSKSRVPFLSKSTRPISCMSSCCEMLYPCAFRPSASSLASTVLLLSVSRDLKRSLQDQGSACM